MPDEPAASAEPPSFAVWAKEYADATASLGDHILSVPWKESTIRTRQLLLGTSLGAVLILVGAKQLTNPTWQQIGSLLGNDVLVWFVTALLLYAIVAYAFATAADAERFRLLTAQRTIQYRAQLEALSGTRKMLDDRLATSDTSELVKAMREIVEYDKASNTIDVLTSDLFKNAGRHYRYQTWTERAGPILLATGVLVRLAIRIAHT